MKKIIATGYVGREPEAKSSQNGEKFVTFSLGISVGNKQSPKTDWVEISCNGKLAEVATSYITKGKKLLIEGFPSVNAYINKENKAVGTLRINVSNIEFLSSGNESEHAGNSEQLKSDEVPF